MAESATTMEKPVATSNRPVKTLRLKGISASVFENHGTSNDGTPSTFHKVIFQRHYRHGVEWKTTESFSRDDLPVVSHLSDRAWEWILETEANRAKDDANA
jgi:hypothetical protein